MEGSSGSSHTSSGGPKSPESIQKSEDLPILVAKSVYILMSKDHRISRNRRAEWFFSRFDSVVSLPFDDVIASVEESESSDFQVVSAIPKDPPKQWSPQTRHSYRYKISTSTIVTYLSRRYRIVYCIDVSPSVAAVDVQAGTVVFDQVFQALKASLDGLMRPFYISGSTAIFQPKIFITVITHSPFVACINNEVILQGKLLGPSTYNDILKHVFERLNSIENTMADMASSLLHNLTCTSDNNFSLLEGEEDSIPTPYKSSIAVSSDFSLVDLLKQALIALSLLPENSSSGLVILTDGVVSVPDGRYLDIILSQLRYNTVSCSFIQLSSPFHPHLCHGVLPYADLMKFIASATFGAFLTTAPEIASEAMTEMNVYHSAFLAWSFQSADTSQAELQPPAIAKPGEWSIRNKCFFTIRDMPIVKKQQYENSLSVDYMKVLSCRLREGFMIKEIKLNDEGQYEITLTLPWKFLIHLEYVLITNKTPQSKTGCILSLEGPYDFLHDVTCLASRSFPSIYRQLMVNRFWATRKNLSESDRLLVHLNSFSSNTAFYNIPDSLRNGVPLFYFSPSSTVPILQSSDFPYPQFAQFWKPVCMLDTTVWQKWMHTHRIGIILEHDHPLPKHLHFPNSTGRFQVILCRQAVMALNTLLKNMSSFVLVENHSYVTLMCSEDDKVPFSFYIIRVTSKPPYVVLRLAFLVGTPGNLRHRTVSVLKEKIASLMFPQRLKGPPRWRFPSSVTSNSSDQTSKATWSDMPCCILMQKPIEKILIRYEKVPENFCEVLMQQHCYENAVDPKSSSSKQSTFGFRPTHPNPWATIMVPEMFNTVARYLYHRRWIWHFPKSLLPNFHIQDASEILSIVTKMRLQEGFRFAYSSAGTVSMVLEVQMLNEACTPAHELDISSTHPIIQETYYTPCVLQFVIFPPTTVLTRNFEEDFESPEEFKDIFLVTECWVEPQCGKLSGCQFAVLNDLEFFEIPDKIFEINKECFLTLGAFEFLRGSIPQEIGQNEANCRRRTSNNLNAMLESNIVMMAFEFELGRVLPKCSQSEILFSMFFQDLRNTFAIEAKNEFIPFHERANEILYNTWTDNLISAHDKEITVKPRHYEEILTMVLSREDVTKTGREPKFNIDDLPAWRCFVKSIDSAQQLITLMPKTLRDTKLLYLIVEKCKCVLTSSESKEGTITSLIAPQLSNCSPNGPKLRHRKISEPNCGQQGVPLSLLTNIPKENSCISMGRKRIRALSGGESAPVLKKALTVDSSFHDILTHNFFDENSSKYIVPKVGQIIVEDVSLDVSNNDLSMGDNSDPPEKMLSESIHEARSMVGSLTMPLYMYDCSLSTLRNHVIFKESADIADHCLDFRIFSIFDENHKASEVNDNASLTSCVKEGAEEARNDTEESDESNTTLQQYCKTLQLAYKQSYIRSVFKSLQLGYYVTTEDLKAVIKLCRKDAISIDITEFLKSGSRLSEPGESCDNVKKIHRFVQRKFRDIMTKKFSHMKVNSDLFYYKSSRLHHCCESISDYDHSIASADLSTNKNGEPKSYSNLWTGSAEDNSHFSGMRRDSDTAMSDTLSPLFMYLKCTTTTTNRTISTIVSDIPFCIDDVFPDMATNCSDKETMDVWNSRLELTFLTCPSEDMSGSTLTEIATISECHNISSSQVDVLKSMIDEIKWLLNDEITSLRSNLSTLTADNLQEIASHVERSSGKLGCFQHGIPLKFVDGVPQGNNKVVDSASKGHSKFVEQFDKLRIPGFGFRKLDNWWYLVSAPLINEQTSGEERLRVADASSTEDRRECSEDQENDITIPDSSENALEREIGHRLPYWIIFRVECDYVFSYCHCRYDEDDTGPLQKCTETRKFILAEIIRLIRIVNQDILLQSLHDTRVCSPLLEPESSKLSVDDAPPLFPSKSFDEAIRRESDIEGVGGQNLPGTFSCDVVWETTFKLHPRLRSGPGKSAFSRGIQILRSTLLAFDVINRENMFVYRNTVGNVFYLRLYRVYETLNEIPPDCPSENPSPRSSVSSTSRAHHTIEYNKEEILYGLMNETQNGSGNLPSDGIVLLKVHGVTEAGAEIKEQLIQSLRNKLDDAVLDVLSVTLDRNPHCKLTPEDVHFIQRPQSAPDAVMRFTTGKFTKLFLPQFAVYLHQNLLQFLNISKYTHHEHGYHFQDYFRDIQERPLEEQNVYLYNQSPGETGSRGVACVSVALIDKSGKLIRYCNWKRPWDFLFSLSLDELRTFIETEEVTADFPLSDILVELCVWKQGRINLDILKNNFMAAVKHGGWDLAMEYQILTPSLFSEVPEDQEYYDQKTGEVPYCKLQRCTPPGSVASLSAGRNLRRRNSSAAQLGKSDTDQLEDLRGRSWSCSVRRVSKPTDLRKNITPAFSKNSLGSFVSSETFRSSFDFIATRKNLVENYSNFHFNYSTMLRQWCHLGANLNLPSLRTITVKLKPQHYLDQTLEELVKIIHSVAPDNSTAQFWKLDKNVREFLTVGKMIHPEYEDIPNKILREVGCFKLNEGKLKSMETKDESEYPDELLKLFRTQEYFKPAAAPGMCVLVARNLSHWEACVCNKKPVDPVYNVSEVIKSFYKFFPLMSEPFSDDKSSLSADKLKFPTKNGLLALLGDVNEESRFQSILVPRQRILVASVSKSSIDFIFYNWSKETSDKLVEQTNLLADWSQSRMQLLSSTLLQKSGIFYNQPFFRNAKKDANLPNADIKELVRSPCPIKSSTLSSKICIDTTQLSDIYRNLHHSHLLKLSGDITQSPISVHGEQVLNLLTSGGRDIESALFRYWLSRGPSASNVIGKEAVEALKQTARTIHYCMTPVFFLPSWRTAIALTRDSRSGLFKRARMLESELMDDKANLLRDRSRHFSETSFRSVKSGTKEGHKLPVWSLWKRLQSERSDEEVLDASSSAPRSPKKAPDFWHLVICTGFIQEYMQYLQTLGFIPTHSNTSVSVTQRKQQILTSDNWNASYVGRLERVRRMSDGSVLSTDSEKSSHKLYPENYSRQQSSDNNEKIFYLQKSLPGGIILLEVGFTEPFCYCKIHALEVHRIQLNKIAQRAATFHNTLAFVDECDKMKVLMHLHSFAYDFHLRTIQSHICGKQIIQQGYHVTKFLDDFINYYYKGPNFARNTVNLGVMVVQNVTTPSHILFNYILSHNQKYGMNVLRMTPIKHKQPDTLEQHQNDYALVHSLSKKVAYKESEDESHFDEFEMSLVISHDSQSSGRVYSTDPSVLRIKYYIVLTSRRELYPKVLGDSNCGKLYPVAVPKPFVANESRSGNDAQRRSFDKGHSESSQDVLFETELEHLETKTEETEQTRIEEEKVLYMGYFSSHEQMMQEIMKEQTLWAETFTGDLIEKAGVDCRRDLLWQRLQVGGKVQPKMRAEKDELTIRETIGVLTFWEFSELLELINIQPLRGVDSRLEMLLNQPLTFFQTLIKLLTNVSQHDHRYFVSPDERIHQLAIINPNINKSVVLIEMNLWRKTNDLCILFKDINDVSVDEGMELDPEILNLIETAVGACCYCNWINCL